MRVFQTIVLVFATACGIATAIDPATVKTLQEFYVSTGGDRWHQNSGWSTPFSEWEDPCALPMGKPDLFGVSCSADGNVANLRLSANNLQGTLNSDFFEGLSHLNTVDLSSNQGLTGEIPAIPPDAALQSLFLQLCRFSGSIPPSIFTPLLQQLHLDSNMLQGPIPDEVGVSTQLQFIYVGNNTGPISGEVPASICNCTRLIVFDAMMSKISSMPSCFGTTMPMLSVINLFKNSLTGSIPSSWCSATELIVLQVQENTDLGGSIPECIGNWTQLQTLAIENTAVGGTIPDVVFSLGTLRSLTLSLSNFYGEIPDEFARLPNLQQATLNGNPQLIQRGQPTYSGRFPRSLFALSSLVTLTIQYTTIDDDMPSVAALGNLSKLTLANNNNIRLSFPLELFLFAWSRPNESPIPRELHLENTPLTGPLPMMTGITIRDLSPGAGAVTLFNTQLQGFVPNATLQWVPEASQKALLRGCSKLLAPVRQWMLPLTDDFTGMQFSLTAASPVHFSMDGGATITVSGSNLYDIRGLDVFHCGFCTAASYDDCARDVATFVLLVPATFNKTTQAFTCTTPPIAHTFPIAVDLYYHGSAYSEQIETFKVSSNALTVTFYDPRPSTFGIAPASGRREGCTALTIFGEGFLNAPLPTVVFSTTDNILARGAQRAGAATERVMRMLFPDIVADSTAVLNDTAVTAVLPFASSANHTATYNQSIGEAMLVRFYPAGRDLGTGFANATYAFDETCDTPLVPCANGYTDPQGCPVVAMCRCHATGACAAVNGTDNYACQCGDGFTGAACDQCEPNHFGAECQKCQCVEGHGACDWGIDKDGSCDCNKWYLGATCSVSKLGLAIGIPVGAALVGAMALFLRRLQLVRDKERDQALLPMNAR